MPAYTTVAIVLRRLQYGETDNILTLYSPDHGRFSAIAKGARKAISRLSGATEVLTCTRFQLATGRSLEIVTQAEVQNTFPALRHDLSRLAHGLYLANLIDHSAEDHEPNPPLYELLYTGLLLLEHSEIPEIVARWCEVQLLRDLGYAPHLDACAVCHIALPGDFSREERFGLSTALGGALCPRHARPASNEDHSGLSFPALTFLQTLDRLTDSRELDLLAAPDQKSLDQIRLALRRYLRYRLERDLKSLEFLDSLRPV